MRLLALDTGSPLTSIAALDGERVALRTLPQRESAAPLMGLIVECLAELGLKLGELDGMVALAGPGSFTGLRVGLSTILGLHQGTGVPAGAVATLPVLASAARATGTVVAAVDALRGEWFVQRLDAAKLGDPESAPDRFSFETLRGWPAATWIGFGVGPLEGLAGQTVEAPPLAPYAARWVETFRVPLDPASLTRPLYLRPPALSPPAAPKRVGVVPPPDPPE